jgi:hypothetical protein
VGDGIDRDRAWDPWESDDDLDGTGPAPVWPALGAIPPALARRTPAAGKPPARLLDVTLPWATLTGLADAPGTLGRIGPITPAQARQLACAAVSDRAAQWRIIITDRAGQAIAVTRIRYRAGRVRAGPAACDGPQSARDGPSHGVGFAGRVTLTISHETIAANCKPGGPGQAGGPGQPRGPGVNGRPGGIAAAALRAAARALDKALAQAEADASVGGCAHTGESQAYRPPPRVREFVIARDLTCRNPVCGQPVWRSDLDHTIPWDDGGRTCSCNLGGACRRDHQLKQHPRWKLEQTRPGWFRWTAPSGRSYTTSPATYVV